MVGSSIIWFITHISMTQVTNVQALIVFQSRPTTAAAAPSAFLRSPAPPNTRFRIIAQVMPPITRRRPFFPSLQVRMVFFMLTLCGFSGHHGPWSYADSGVGWMRSGRRFVGTLALIVCVLDCFVAVSSPPRRSIALLLSLFLCSFPCRACG